MSQAVERHDDRPQRGRFTETVAVHAGTGDDTYGAVVPPIYQASTFASASAEQAARLFAGQEHGYVYSRLGNPTVAALERCVARLEGGTHALACSSGMAAIHTVLAGLLDAGDHVVGSAVTYGTTQTLLSTHLPRWGIEVTTVDTSDLTALRGALRPTTRVLFIETPGNPTLAVTDLHAACRLAHDHGVTVVVDNTFMSPVLQQPFKWGADIVVHSMTKFLNGHADVVAGIIVTRLDHHHDAMRNMLTHLGGVLGPFEAFLVHRGIKTLPLRIERQCTNARRIAEFLEAHPAVEWVRYPWLPSHPQVEITRRQCCGGGAVISFGLRGGVAAGRCLMDHVRLCTLAVSLGGVETLIEHPATMTHAAMSPAARRQAHITDGLVRLSVGIEHVEDLIADVGHALDIVYREHVGVDDVELEQHSAGQLEDPYQSC